MWWMAVAGAAKGLVHGKLGRVQADIDNRLSKVNADAANKVRAAGNELSAARGNLDRWIQSVNNNYQLEAGGDALEANVVNYRRDQDLTLTGNFEQSIREAEQYGMQAAMAGASGLAGSVVDMVNSATILRNERAKEAALQQGDYRNFAFSQRAQGIWAQTIRGLDNSMILDEIDYNRNVATVTPKQSVFTNILRGVDSAFGGGDPDTYGGVQKDKITNPNGSGYQPTQFNRGASVFRQDGSVDYSLTAPKARAAQFDTWKSDGTVDYGITPRRDNNASMDLRLGENSMQRVSFNWSLGSGSNSIRLGGS